MVEYESTVTSNLSDGVWVQMARWVTRYNADCGGPGQLKPFAAWNLNGQPEEPEEPRGARTEKSRSVSETAAKLEPCKLPVPFRRSTVYEYYFVCA